MDWDRSGHGILEKRERMVVRDMGVVMHNTKPRTLGPTASGRKLIGS